MANINDFKLLNVKAAKYFDILSKELSFDTASLTDIMKKRLGFYLFMLENICGFKEISDLIAIITDTEFNKIVKGEIFEDNGVDAVFINSEENSINLFNFKYREAFTKEKKQAINDTIISTKLINALINEKTDKLPPKMMGFANSIIEKLNSKEIWKLNLYVVSNENVVLNREDNDIKQLEDLYDLNLVPIGLDAIRDMMSIRPEPISAVLILDTDAVMSFSESIISSSKSYIARIPLSELIRITCNNKGLRNNYSIEDLTPLSSVELDFAVLFDNVRGFVQKSKYNKNIQKSLGDSPTKFFMYNNGLTITADDVKAEEVNAGKKVKLDIQNFQVVNGGQTLRTIHNFNKGDFITKNLSKAEVLIRIFKAASDNSLTNLIAEYTNSQNAISSIDLKSLSSEQIEIEQYLDEHNIIYARKNGDTGISETKTYDHKISMERFGQVLYSIKGFPERASNHKKDIFEKDYDKLFLDGNLDLNKTAEYVREYFEIKKTYENNSRGFAPTDQKFFYIIYLRQRLSDSIDDLIKLLEAYIPVFNPDKSKTIPDSRKLILPTFKEFLNIKFGLTT